MSDSWRQLVDAAAPLLVLAAWVAGWAMGSELAPLIGRPYPSERLTGALSVVCVALTVAAATARLRSLSAAHPSAWRREHYRHSALLYLLFAYGAWVFFSEGAAPLGHLSGLGLALVVVSAAGALANGLVLAVQDRRSRDRST